MRRALTGWIIVAVCFVCLGLGAVVGGETAQVRELPAGTIQQWRQYAGEVERGIRTPSGAATRMLTETAIAQQAHAKSAVDLLRLVGAGVALLGLFLAVDLIRYRGRHGTNSTTP
jgi:hypothetical protein